MKQGCTSCGGPLFRRECLGCSGSRRSIGKDTGLRTREDARSNRAETAIPASFKGQDSNFLNWRSTFKSSRGGQLNVAMFRAYRVTPQGHEVLVWEPGMRWPA